MIVKPVPLARAEQSPAPTEHTTKTSPSQRRPCTKKDTPVPRFGTRACLLRGATQIRGIFKIPPLLRRLRAARTGDFGAFAPYTHARRTSFPGSLQKPFSKAAFSLRRRGSGTASASLRVIGSIFCFSSSCANPDRRAAARGSAFLPRPDSSPAGRCTCRRGGWYAPCADPPRGRYRSGQRT